MNTKEDSKKEEPRSQGINDPTPSRSSSTSDEAVDDSDDDGEGQSSDAATFPQQLWDAVEHQTEDGGTFAADRARVVEWLPEGDSFIIRDKKIFENEVLTKYFNRCKFLSFTRKLYRWGFRQGKSSTQTTKIYAHKHFVRSDKQRCLKLRSIVKQPPARLQPQAQDPHGYNAAHSGRIPPVFADTLDTHRHGVTRSPNAIMTGNTVFSPQAAHPLLQMQGNSALSLSSLGLGGRSNHNNAFLRGSLGMSSTSSIGMQDSQFSRGSLGTASTDILEARLHRDELEQRRRQIMNMLNDSTPRTAPSFNPFGISYNPSMASQPSATATMAPSNNYQPTSISTAAELKNKNHPSLPPQPLTAAMGHTDNHGNYNDVRDMSEVTLACEMMKGDTSMEAWRALELAKHIHNKK